MNHTSIQSATIQRAALAGVLPSTDPRIAALTLAVETGDEAIAAAALAFVERQTPAEVSALVAVKRNLLEAAQRFAPTWALVVDVCGTSPAANAPPNLGDHLQQTEGIRFAHRFELVPTTMPDGRPLCARVIFPCGVSTAHVSHAMRLLEPNLAELQKMSPMNRAATLAAAVSTTTTKGK